eukprot:11222949-Lingulodinium_polyedra.AAC.1
MDHRLRQTQFGFRAGRSTSQPLFVLQRLQEMALDTFSPFYTLFLDWEKAFDTISHNGIHAPRAGPHVCEND